MADRPLLILASQSPRRLDLLAQAGIVPDRLCPVTLDETARPRELPAHLACRLAEAKAQAVFSSLVEEARASILVLAADTVVAVGRRIIDKPENHDEAEAALSLLSGRSHRVFTAVCLVTQAQRRTRLVETRVRFKYLNREDRSAYLHSGEWRGKAGGYAIQGIAGGFVQRLSGSYTAVVGLPLRETLGLLEAYGYPIRHGWGEKEKA